MRKFFVETPQFGLRKCFCRIARSLILRLFEVEDIPAQLRTRKYLLLLPFLHSLNGLRYKRVKGRQGFFVPVQGGRDLLTVRRHALARKLKAPFMGLQPGVDIIERLDKLLGKLLLLRVDLGLIELLFLLVQLVELSPQLLKAGLHAFDGSCDIL